ncbi:Predicted nucleic acid-binding protein, contains PIN domain [Kytococcus aerolatus]|uniref:Ribonuclease VapC n=1 Tax=Kytococcus aerolatus TaxID=592308 RepID=A0A212U153_9MICO|nr:type II toxin-antitoxin system VapC family toxin [Kytococcus aerolatus]SNC71995.1 Predicted nucleic acid-binding protein, contains PIN domain [Kytococcus aerolatus]
MILDANVIIALLNGTDVHHQEAVEIIAEATGDLLVPELTLAEALVHHVRAGTAEDALVVLRELGLETLSGPSPLVLAELRVETRLRMPDCVVLGAAEQSGQPLVTFDEQLARAAEGRGVRTSRDPGR